MTIEIRPSGIKCNLQCKYCYQNKMRDNNEDENYDSDINKLLEKTNGQFTLFGGEALVTPINKLEKILKYGYEKYNKTGIQTNGTLINKVHIKLFKKYNTHVGISVDGRGKMNDLRWAGTKEKTRKMTKKTLKNIDILLSHDITPSLIITLHRLNASEENIGDFKDWLRELSEKGIWSVRLHLLEKEGVEADKYALSNDGYLRAFLDLADFNSEVEMDFDIFRDINLLLKGKDNQTTCLFNGCDPWYTSSVSSIEENKIAGCGRPHKDGIDWNKADKKTFIRNLILYQTPQEDGGCKDCRFFSICKGNCPGTAIDGDWRNRSEYCEFYKTLFKKFEKKHLEVGITPFTKTEERERIEEEMMNKWLEGKSAYIFQIKQDIKNNSCNRPRKQENKTQHGDSQHGDSQHGDSQHGDRPHGDAHGDHYDN